jgi:hypothetical protein
VWASYNGVSSDPLGDRASALVGFAAWDLLPTAVSPAGTITNLAAGTGDLGITLSQSVSGSYPYGNPGTTDQFYTFFGATSWTISGTASVAIDKLAFQIRMSPPASSSGATSTTFYSPLLNGVGATAQLTATGLDADPDGFAAQGFDIVQWNWSGLNIAAGETFSLTFANPAGGYHVAIDSMAVDVQAVPEPSTLALIALAGFLGGAGMHRRLRPRNAIHRQSFATRR